ncbi:CBS domain-containing protein [Polynucleobacter paneuropaeus]|jgi:CBS domain-containing protein|uniref:CBS domain-containing protein n=1 Tax=Polynucleobacter paneuropaeus TaxID=2527775 RepID=UPI001BFDE25A|nr:CBS domain-containing protein [Polynucleobacter paneuropaeus]MBT8539979.1 CBS domain-containing protein [Polynucleobacter paneuropaeus]MBT8542983.1 CBS domain-containing protein [Polynucleobacter paneuropaeus]MBT8575313.1 CBS domain-containing protein [Polynucleobacter paneuropaeus]MBT8580168.1 CBS domain-containing protein [Polynucleobacter paneuropaeus]MBT8623053.1 CBS domain-containing protein [Polynucleobacter paneuropaeus]
MPLVKNCLANKSNTLISVQSSDYVVKVLELMRYNLVRSVLVIDSEKLVGIISQGDCAIKVLLPGLSAKEILVKDVMTANPISVGYEDDLRDCMQIMISKRIRHLPVVDGGVVVGVISVGDVVKDTLEHRTGQIKFLERYIKQWDSSQNADT